MKLIGELKKQVESTATKEEAKDVIANAGMELTDDELDNVVGGWASPNYIKDVNQLSEEERKLLLEKGEELKQPYMGPLFRDRRNTSI